VQGQAQGDQPALAHPRDHRPGDRRDHEHGPGPRQQPHAGGERPLVQGDLLEAMKKTAPNCEPASRFAAAIEADDIDAVVALLTEDVIVSMPPQREWHQGRAAVHDFLSVRHLSRKGRWRFAATKANGQPAYAYYLLDGGVWRRMGMFVVAARAGGIASITRCSEIPVPQDALLPEHQGISHPRGWPTGHDYFHEFAGLSQFGVPERLPE